MFTSGVYSPDELQKLQTAYDIARQKVPPKVPPNLLAEAIVRGAETTRLDAEEIARKAVEFVKRQSAI